MGKKSKKKKKKKIWNTHSQHTMRHRGLENENIYRGGVDNSVYHNHVNSRPSADFIPPTPQPINRLGEGISVDEIVARSDGSYWGMRETQTTKPVLNEEQEANLKTASDEALFRSKRAKDIWDQDGYRESREGLFAGKNNPQYGKYGADHPAYGNKHTKETKEKIANAHKGKIVSQETRDKLSETRIRIMAPQKAETKKRNVRIRLEKRAAHKKNIELGVYQGENSGPSKISDDERQEICLRRYDGESYKRISNDYPLGLTGIKEVCFDWGPRNGFPFKRIVAKRSS